MNGYDEQVNYIGAIQDVGYVVAVRSDLTIFAISENLVNAPWNSDLTISDILGKSITDLFINETSELIINLIVRFQSIVANSESIPYARNFTILNNLSKGSRLQFHEKILCCSVVGCSNKDIFILEFEDPAGNTGVVSNARILRTGDIVERIRSADSIQDVTASFANSVMSTMLGYDRCMVYCLGSDNSGFVMQEFTRANLELEYLGLKFPAKDIPLTVRQLFLKNTVRFVFDTNGQDSKIVMSEVESDPLDLTMCSLRACSKCHIQYLHDMRIISSMAVAIVIEDKLWGLYLFHSYHKATKPTVDERIMLEMSASITAMKIDGFQRERHAIRKLEANRVMLLLQSVKSLNEFLVTYSAKVLEVLEAHTLVVYSYDGLKGQLTLGDTNTVPTQTGYSLLHAKCKMNSYVVQDHFEEGLSGNASGVIFFKYQYITVAFVRKKTPSDVMWTGYSGKMHAETEPPRLCATFSRTWSSEDCELAEFVMDRMNHFLHSEMLASFRLSLEQTNSECIQAIESARERYEFFAQMSHELRTPFHGIMSSLQLLKSVETVVNKPERTELIKSALECGKTMLRTLDDILTIAKSKKCVDLSILPVVLSKIAGTALRIMGPIAEHKAIQLHNKLGHLQIGSQLISQEAYESLVVMGDETRLGQIANNLTNNAIKFTPSGGYVTICVHIAPSLQDVWKLWNSDCGRFENNYVPIPEESKPSEIWYIFEVEDSGCGVSGNDMRTMFDAYKQLPSDVKTYQGTGLGLHICRLHVERMGGIFGVASTQGTGTLFFCAIPMDLMKENKSIPPLSVSHSGISINFEQLSDNICPSDSLFMIVDDSLINLKLSKRKMLLTLGDSCTVVTAEDGLASIQMYQDYIENGKQSLLNGIFMDYHMPKCSGLEAIKEIRRLEQKHPELIPVYIVAFTADMSETSSRELIHAGANEVLPKPAATGQLEAICMRLACAKSPIQCSSNKACG